MRRIRYPYISHNTKTGDLSVTASFGANDEQCRIKPVDFEKAHCSKVVLIIFKYFILFAAHHVYFLLVNLFDRGNDPQIAL